MRFMGSPLSFFACIGTMNRPLTRPSGTLSPSEGERDGVRGPFMESLAPPNRTGSCLTGLAFESEVGQKVALET